MSRPLGIRAYLAISYSALLILSLGAIGFIWSQNEYRAITRQIESLMRDRVTLLSDVVEHELAENDDIRGGQAQYAGVELSKDTVAVFIDGSGSVVELFPGTVSPADAALFAALSGKYDLPDHSPEPLVKTDTDAGAVYAAAQVFSRDNELLGTVNLLTGLDGLETYVSQVRWMFLGAILVVLLLGVALSTLLANAFSRQFSNAQRLASSVAEGNYQLRLPVTGPAELRVLARSLNRMTETLEEQLQARARLLANVTHELARPLAGLQLGIESLRKGAARDPDLGDDLLVSMEQTIQRFEGLIDDITLAAQPTSRPIDLHLSAIALEPFLRGVATRFWAAANSRRIRFDVSAEEGLPPVLADEKRLGQILGNLVDNALKFTPHGGTIRLSGEKVDDGYERVLVHDGGRGITPDEAEHLFEPFFQGETGRNMKQGMGLGLAISQQLARAQGGSLTLENHPAGGALAILVLPTANT
jgi:two-component system sensor histidine kinase BaeS